MTMRVLATLLTIVGIVVSMTASSIHAAQTDAVPSGIPDDAEAAVVTSHVDGEKFKVTLNGEEEEVRMIGIDAPEMKGEGDLPECYAQESLDHLASVIPVGETVYLQKDAEDKDNKDRLWRYVWIEGPIAILSELLNETIVENGYAIDREEETNTKFDQEIADAQKTAKSGNAGLWQGCGGGHVATTPVPVHGSEDEPGQFGETLVAESVEVTLTNIAYSYDYNFSTPKGGYVFMILEVQLQNKGEDEKNYDSVRFTARDLDTDAKFEEAFVLLDQPLGSGELSTGEYVSGQVAIEVQESAVNIRVQYQISSFGDNSVYWIVPSE